MQTDQILLRLHRKLIRHKDKKTPLRFFFGTGNDLPINIGTFPGAGRACDKLQRHRFFLSSLDWDCCFYSSHAPFAKAHLRYFPLLTKPRVNCSQVYHTFRRFANALQNFPEKTMITGKIDCGLLIFRSCSQLQITAFQKRSYTKLHKKGETIYHGIKR